MANVTALLMKSFVKAKVTPKGATTTEQRCDILRFLAAVLSSPITMYETKQIVNEILSYIVMKAPTTIDEDSLTGLGFQHAFTMIGEGSKSSFLGGLLLIEAVLDGCSKDAKTTGNIYRAIVARMLEMGARLLNHLEPEFVAWNQSDRCNFAELGLS